MDLINKSDVHLKHIRYHDTLPEDETMEEINAFKSNTIPGILDVSSLGSVSVDNDSTQTQQ